VNKHITINFVEVHNILDSCSKLQSGRRRIGKTFLIREYYSHKDCIFFQVTGVQGDTTKMQLKKFANSISEVFLDNINIESPKTWGEAFELLQKQIIKTNKKIVIFLDELPWLAVRKSRLLQEIDYFWNHHWSTTNKVILIICGSSASWLIKKIIYNKGGLHNRITCQIRLLPFTLSETKNYLHNKKIKLNYAHILNLYMALGGVPYYLNYVTAGLTAQENIQKIIFDNNAPLRDEFTKLFHSLFDNTDAYIELIKIIAQKQEGIRRAEITTMAKYSANGGTMSKRLNDLCTGGFLKEYVPWGRNNGEYYKLIDEFCLFYLTWVDIYKNKQFASNYWLNQIQQPSYYAWSGYAFEAICTKHINNITNALKINTASTISAWRFIPRKHLDSGVQIDLVIDRTDNAISLCEIKYTNTQFTIDKRYANILQKKIEIFLNVTKTKKQIFMNMVCANGLKQNSYAKDLIAQYATLDDLFK